MRFTVYGHPATAGSKRSFAIKRAGQYTGKTATADDNRRTKSWQGAVKDAAIQACGDAACLDGPVYLSVVFFLHRPQGHYRTGRFAHLLSDRAPRRHFKRPDLLKLTRAIEDALTGVLWRDDAQICDEHLSKRYAAPGQPERVTVVVSPADAPPEGHKRLQAPLPGQLDIAHALRADGGAT